jgi:hypothetical protein
MKFILSPAVSRLVSLDAKSLSRDEGEILLLPVMDLMWDTFSDERAADIRQRIIIGPASRQDFGTYLTASDSRLVQPGGL